MFASFLKTNMVTHPTRYERILQSHSFSCNIVIVKEICGTK